jgi:murein DD-endopeptidase MepM/ murein hydrolase activator NlpD
MRQLFYLTILSTLLIAQPASAYSRAQQKVIDSGIPHFNVEETQCTLTGGGTSGGGTEQLEGHRLPAYRGGAGIEETINEDGQVPSTGGRVTFYDFASLGQDYRDFYIAMRWRYATWAWNGTSRAGSEDVGWYAKNPRKVLVTNPATGKSIIAAILESGPAPWTGTPAGYDGIDEPPSYWQGYVEGTPEGYNGRVAGFPPRAVEALGMEQWAFGGPGSGHPSGSGHELVYSWAPDQAATPGPTALAAGSGASLPPGNTSPVCSTGSFGISASGFVFPLQTTKEAIEQGSTNEAGERATWCYQNETNCHHDYNAADIHVEPGTPVIAAKPGKIVRAVNQGGGVGSRVTIKGDGDGVLYYYTHMTNGSVTLQEDSLVAGGQQVGTVGDSGQAEGTAPHLHFDALPSEYDHRPSCGGAACSGYPFIDVQSILLPAYKALPEKGIL